MKKILTLTALIVPAFCIFISPSFAQIVVTKQTNEQTEEKKDDKKDDKKLAPPVAPSAPAPSPDVVAYMKISRERDLTKKIAALEKFIVDFPNSFSATLAQSNLLDAIIKQTPDRRDKIYAQALRTTANAPDYLRYYTYEQVADRLLEAGMNDKAEEFANKGLIITEQELAELSFSRRSNYWITLGKINLKKGNLIKSELLFRRAINGK